MGRPTGPLTRAALALGAVVVALWLAGNLRAVELEEDALNAMGRAVSDGVKPAEVDEADRLFRRARRFAPDAQLKIREGGILIFAQPDRSRALLEAAARQEPENVEAWALLYGVSGGRRDPAGAVARRRALALDPLARGLLRRVDAGR